MSNYFDLLSIKRSSFPILAFNDFKQVFKVRKTVYEFLLVNSYYRATHMQSADYAVARCLSVRLSHADILSTPLNIC